ncbi:MULTISPECIES: hypothetical protein [unclassified Clostridium]|uniref:hypothetical protein n=1 Tax=unclassified Clostridium TaxID=2614128 RepID=UPI001C8C64AF|nr:MULTISPECIES: hypothetical protein [unclassified Clostridium]MBX9138646.1 hypothetical protein [Clostridium sp. K12(2020)]MBX9145419.1 hypothetical protein [Clostridium sp. K13]
MININKIMKENVSINMSLDVENRGLWEKGNQLGCDTITLTIPVNEISNDIDIDKLENDLHFGVSNFTINSNEVKFNIFTGETIFFSSLVSIYEYIEHYVSFLCEKLDRFTSESFKLEFDFYMSFMED